LKQIFIAENKNQSEENEEKVVGAQIISKNKENLLVID